MNRLIWTIDRAFRRHGAQLWVAVIGVLVILALSISLRAASSELKSNEQEVADAIAALRKPRSVGTREASGSLKLPAFDQRFEVTRRIISTLKKSGMEPERIRFKFENEEDARLTRQIVSFSLDAPWTEVGQSLNQLQAADRSIYISRLRVSRTSADNDRVVAEIQLAVAFSDGE